MKAKVIERFGYTARVMGDNPLLVEADVGRKTEHFAIGDNAGTHREEVVTWRGLPRIGSFQARNITRPNYGNSRQFEASGRKSVPLWEACCENHFLELVIDALDKGAEFKIIDGIDLLVTNNAGTWLRAPLEKFGVTNPVEGRTLFGKKVVRNYARSAKWALGKQMTLCVADGAVVAQ